MNEEIDIVEIGEKNGQNFFPPYRMDGSERSNVNPKVDLVAKMAINNFESIDKREKFLAQHKQIEPQVRARIEELTTRKVPAPGMQAALI